MTLSVDDSMPFFIYMERKIYNRERFVRGRRKNLSERDVISSYTSQISVSKKIHQRSEVSVLLIKIILIFNFGVMVGVFYLGYSLRWSLFLGFIFAVIIFFFKYKDEGGEGTFF